MANIGEVKTVKFNFNYKEITGGINEAGGLVLGFSAMVSAASALMKKKSSAKIKAITYGTALLLVIKNIAETIVDEVTSKIVDGIPKAENYEVELTWKYVEYEVVHGGQTYQSAKWDLISATVEAL